MESRNSKQELEVRGIMGVSPGPSNFTFLFLSEEENLDLIFCWYKAIITTKEKRVTEKYTFLNCFVRK